MSEDPDRSGLLSSERRALLKGLGLGAIATAGAGYGLSAVAPSLSTGAREREPDHVTGQHVRRLVRPSDVTHHATGGRWADASTWEDGVPDDGARVRVPVDTTVTVDHEDTACLRTIRVDGTLRFVPDTDAHLGVDTLVVMGEGRLEMGTPDAPVAEGRARVTFLDTGPIDESWDPERVSRGLVTLPGSKVVIEGREKTPFAALATPPRAGDASLELAASPTGWRSEDTLVVAGVHPERNEDEEVTVAGVDGSTVRLDGELEHDHVPPRGDLPVHVANLDRTVRFQSESTAIPRRGHVMFMGRDVTVRGAGFYDLGRTDKSRPFTDPANGVPPNDVDPNPQARYGCHFHRTGIDTDDQQRVVEGSVVWGSPGWGFVNHNSYVRFADNVSYQVFGAGFVAEIGNETGSFRRNFALRSQGSGDVPDGRQFKPDSEGSIDDFGHGGYGFWFQGPGVAVADNVAAGHRHHGFVYWTRAKPDRSVDPEKLDSLTGDVPNFPVEYVQGQPELKNSDRVVDGRVPSSFVALESFAGNTVYASGGGLDVSRHRFTEPSERREVDSVIADFTAYNVGSHYSQWDSRRVPNQRGSQGGANGIAIRYSANVQIRSATLVSGAGPDGVGVNRNHAVSNVRVADSDLEGWKVGVRAFPRGDSPVLDTRLDNEVDVQVIGGSTDRKWSPKQRVDVTDCEFAPGGRADLFVSAALDDDLYGLFTPEGHLRLDGQAVYFDAQRPSFVPFPTRADVMAADPGDDPFHELGDVSTTAIVGKPNAQLRREFGLSVEGSVVPDSAGRTAAVEGGFVAGSGDDGDDDRLIAHVSSAAGSLFERGRLRQGERLYVYHDHEFLAVPGRYAGLPYVRPEIEDADGERRSYLALRLSAPATVFVAYDADVDSPPGWLSGWTDTGDTLGTEDGTRRVYRRNVDVGLTWFGGCPNTHRMYTPFVRRR